MICRFLVPTAVVVGFNPTTYTEEEGDTVVFTVQILEGQAQINVVVNFNTADVSANGKQK